MGPQRVLGKQSTSSPSKRNNSTSDRRKPSVGTGHETNRSMASTEKAVSAQKASPGVRDSKAGRRTEASNKGANASDPRKANAFSPVLAPPIGAGMSESIGASVGSGLGSVSENAATLFSGLSGHAATGLGQVITDALKVLGGVNGINDSPESNGADGATDEGANSEMDPYTLPTGTPIDQLGTMVSYDRESGYEIRKVKANRMHFTDFSRPRGMLYENELMLGLQQMDWESAARNGITAKHLGWGKDFSEKRDVYYGFVRLKQKDAAGNPQTRMRITSLAVTDDWSEEFFVRDFDYVNVLDGARLQQVLMKEAEKRGSRVELEFNRPEIQEIGTNLITARWVRAWTSRLSQPQDSNPFDEFAFQGMDRDIRALEKSANAGLTDALRKQIVKVQTNTQDSLSHRMSKSLKTLHRLEELRYFTGLFQWMEDQQLTSTDVGFIPSSLLHTFGSPAEAYRRLTSAIHEESVSAAKENREASFDWVAEEEGSKVYEGVVTTSDSKGESLRIKLRWVEGPGGHISLESGKILSGSQKDAELPVRAPPPEPSPFVIFKSARREPNGGGAPGVSNDGTASG